LVVRQVRQALQQTVAIGAFSAYFPATCAMRPVAICFIRRTVAPLRVVGDFAERQPVLNNVAYGYYSGLLNSR